MKRPKNTKCGRKQKQRKPKDFLKSAINLVTASKADDAIVPDVMKTSANFEGFSPTYNEAYRVLKGGSIKSHQNEIKSYQLIIPYLEKLKLKNEGSTLAYHRLADKSIHQVFFVQG